MSGARSRNKGHNYERELVHLFRKHFPDLTIKRGLGQTRDGSECPDVEMPHFWIEAKRGKKTNIKAALRQAFIARDVREEEDCRMPIAVCRDDREEATATLMLSDLMPMLVMWVDYKEKSMGNLRRYLALSTAKDEWLDAPKDSYTKEEWVDLYG